MIEQTTRRLQLPWQRRLETAAVDSVECFDPERYPVFGRICLIFAVIGFALMLNGCTKCGPIWDDWLSSPKSCRSDHS
jgi:hypothetical protein